MTDIDDFYEGLFNSDFYWYDYESEQWGYNPTDRTQYDYGYVKVQWVVPGVLIGRDGKHD